MEPGWFKCQHDFPNISIVLFSTAPYTDLKEQEQYDIIFLYNVMHADLEILEY